MISETTGFSLPVTRLPWHVGLFQRQQVFCAFVLSNVLQASLTSSQSFPLVLIISFFPVCHRFPGGFHPFPHYFIRRLSHAIARPIPIQPGTAPEMTFWQILHVFLKKKNALAAPTYGDGFSAAKT